MAAPKGNQYALGNEGGRPKIGLEILWEGWYNDILELYSEAASDVEIRALIYHKTKEKTKASFGLWERWIKDYPKFKSVVETGRELSKGKSYNISDFRKKKLERRKSIRNYKKEYESNKFSYSQRSLLNYHLKKQGFSKSKKSFDLFGYTPSELAENIKTKLKDGMTFDNYGEWHIDHIKPLSKFNLKDENQIKKAWSFDNLQCLWKLDNLRKSNK